MSMKKADLDKNMALKLGGRMRAAGVPDRFARGAAAALEKRQRRARDAAAGLVPFACKLPADLVKRIHERSVADAVGVDALMLQWVTRGLE